MKWLPALIILGGFAVERSEAQSTRSLINEGNDLYEDEQYPDAEIRYRKALEQEAQSVEGRFNLGNALHRQKKYEESAHEFESAAMGTGEKGARAGSYYNRGNSFFEAEQYEKAIESYIESLKLNPSDADAKYNLSYARRKLKEQQQQNDDKSQDDQKDQQKDQDQKNQDKQDQNKQDQNKQDQQDNQNQQDTKDGQQQEQDQQQKEQAGKQEVQMSKADAERILEVLKNQEREVQKKLRAKPRSRAKTDKDW